MADLVRERAALVVDDSVAVPVGTAVPAAASIAPASSSEVEDAPASAAVGDGEMVAGLHWSVLPPLLRPNIAVRRKQSAIGCAVVIGTIIGCVSATHTAVWFGELSDPLPTVFVTAIWAETIVALACLLGLMFGDPGIIARSEERCTPVPSGLIRTTLVRFHSTRHSLLCRSPCVCL